MHIFNFENQFNFNTKKFIKLNAYQLKKKMFVEKTFLHWKKLWSKMTISQENKCPDEKHRFLVIFDCNIALHSNN